MSDIKLGKQVLTERSHLKEKNDCTVRALMEALEIPYLEAYGMLLASGRKKGKALRCDDLYDAFAVAKFPRPGMIVERYIKYIAHSGNWIIEIRGHVFAVVNREIKDIYPAGNLSRHVVQAWRMK